jgi:hypothetical protein
MHYQIKAWLLTNYTDSEDTKDAKITSQVYTEVSYIPESQMHLFL